MSENEVEGGCLCGAVRFRIGLPVQFCIHCHCSMCRRAHGAGYVTWIGVATETFRIIRGEDLLARHKSSTHGRRSFCSQCGSSMLCESSQHPKTIDVTLANVDGPVGCPPAAHAYFDNRAEWISADDGLPRLGGKTGVEPT